MTTSTQDMLLSTLLQGYAPVPAALDCPLAGIQMDSRKVRAGDVFLAVAGIASHGLDHVQGALQQGAVAVAYEPVPGMDVSLLADRAGVPFVAVERLSAVAGEIASRFYGEPSASLFTVGVTGTNGKTSVASFVAQALGAQGVRCGVMGTLGYGFPEALSTATHTTPDAITVQETLANLRDAEAQAVAMEVSSHSLVQGRVSGVAFDVAVFTNLSRDHLDYHGSMGEYAAAKRQLLAMPGLSTAVVNVDDEEGRRWAAEAASSLKLLAYSVTGSDADLHFSHVKATLQGLSATLHVGGETAALQTRLIGDFNLSNLLATAGVLLAWGMTVGEIAERLAEVQPAAGRMQLVATGADAQPAVVVDYAHTPDALEKALSALRAHCEGELICVFGCGGDRDQGKRPMMASVAESLADRVIVTDDNPRTESAEAIVADILRGFKRPNAALTEHDRATAIERAISSAGPKDCVLIAGKGHENYQLIGDKVLPFDDVAVARQILAGGAA